LPFEEEFHEILPEEQIEFPFMGSFQIRNLSQVLIEAIYQAIHPETQVNISERGKTTIRKISETTIQLSFFAKDFVSLRAMIGSFLRWIDTAEQSIEVCNK
jgi:tRNA threonylcarbamoyladenosine modification (KEOPS) complex  Pcc1 subunit